MNTTIHTQLLSRKVGQKIINFDNTSILNLDKEEIINLFKSYGLLLFRGFENDVQTFTEFTNLFSTNFIDYTGGVFNRRVIDGNTTILSVNDFKNEIKLHGEMYYQKNIPLMLWFFCAHPALQNGETTVCDGQLFFDELSDSLKKIFTDKKIKYVSHVNKETWLKRYKTDDLSKVEQMCRSNNIQLKINEDESIELEYVCPAIHPNRAGDHLVFINSLLPAKKINPNLVCFDDNSEIAEDIILQLNEVAERVTGEICWQKGDILMVDNTRIMHGRRAFVDDKRDIYLRLCSPGFPF